MVEVKGFEPPLTSSDRLADSGLSCQSCGQKLPISGQQVETTNEPDDATGTFDVASRALVGHSGSTIRAQSDSSVEPEHFHFEKELSQIVKSWHLLADSVQVAISRIVDSWL